MNFRIKNSQSAPEVAGVSVQEKSNRFSLLQTADQIMGFLITALVGIIAAFVFRVWFRVEVDGVSRFQALNKLRRRGHGGFLVVSNHKTHLDSYLFVAVFCLPGMLFEWLITRNNPVPYHAGKAHHHHSNWWKVMFSRHFHVMPVSDGKESLVIRALIRTLSTHIVHIFPEGTRDKGAGVKQAKPGVGMMAVKANVPVLPIYVGGMEQVQDPSAPGSKLYSIHWRNFRSRICIRVGEPLKFAPDRKDYLEISREILDSIYTLSTRGPS
ncbi:MAG: lysophospholipid acyltransferase family protein [bacterium]